MIDHLIDIYDEKFSVSGLSSVTINGDTVELTFHRDGKARVRTVRKNSWDAFYHENRQKLKIDSPHFQIFGDKK